MVKGKVDVGVLVATDAVNLAMPLLKANREIFLRKRTNERKT
jgi:hypothetical protein